MLIAKKTAAPSRSSGSTTRIQDAIAAFILIVCGTQSLTCPDIYASESDDRGKPNILLILADDFEDLPFGTVTGTAHNRIDATKRIHGNAHKALEVHRILVRASDAAQLLRQGFAATG